MITGTKETTNDYLEKLIQSIGERLSDLIMRLVESKLDRYFKKPAKISFTEREAAQFLGVGIDTVRRWRKEGLINYVNYPSAQAGRNNETGLSSMFNYDIADLLDFRDRYKRKHYQPRFEIKREVPVTGAEIESKS